MSKSTHPITYVYDIDGHTVELTREHMATAYARNGNVSNPTEYFLWRAVVDGETIASMCQTRLSAYEHARARVLGHVYYDHPNYPHRWQNVRNFRTVQTEMAWHYRRRERAT